MPGGAHHRAGSPVPVRPTRAAESGFTLTELIVVIVLVAIALGVGVTTLLSVRRNAADVRYVAAATTVWRGIGSYRLDNKGKVPPAGELAGGGARFTNLAGARYVRSWPEDPTTGRPLELQAAGGRPGTSGPPNTVRYASAGDSAWLAAYGHDGRIVFLRGITTGAPVVPVG